jgi:iron complex outermembrane receptor protein
MRCKKASLSLMVASILAIPAGAQAQLEEIVVTARMRAEAYEDAPVAIKAFTAAEIEEAGIETPHDFIGLTPNVTIVQTQNPGNSFVTIRGVSQARNSDMPVAVLVDGVLMSNPAQLNQQLFDIEQIEVLKGPQGALYGRNAIGGAVTIVTKQPSDVFESKIRVGADSGPGYSLQGAVSGPMGDSDALRYRASLSYSDTDGYLDNEFLNTQADPYKDLSARLKLLWQPNDNFTADARFSVSQIDTTALYFVINDDFTGILPNANDLSGVTVNGPANDSNYTGVPILSNNLGEGIKDMSSVSLKLDYETDNGTFTSITAYDDLEEILTGDAFDFRPIGRSFNEIIFPLFSGLPPFDPGFADWNQSQYLEVSSVSQEFRFTSPAENRFRWIAGAYFIETDRFIGTGNMVDTGTGVNRVYREPRTTTGFPYDFSIPNPQATYLSDSQDNSAWAVFTSMSYDFNDEWEGTFSLRYDEDERTQTTDTPPGFIPAALAGDLVTGQQRTQTWDAMQPKFTLRWQPQDNLTVYGDLSRGFRSGGFNQSGVALAGVAGVFDTFDEQIADTIELGVKAQFAEDRINTSFSIYDTDLEGAYYFIFLVASSTQNLGSLDEVSYQGIEFELDALLAENFELNLGLAFTDSEIESDASIPHVVGQKVPLTSDYTLNLGSTYRHPLQNGAEFFIRGDYRIIGKTYWGPGDPGTSPLPWDQSPRDDVSILDMRMGVQGDDWSVALWAKNLLDEEYNDEFSHPFVWKALPARWGVQYSKSF